MDLNKLLQGAVGYGSPTEVMYRGRHVTYKTRVRFHSLSEPIKTDVEITDTETGTCVRVHEPVAEDTAISMAKEKLFGELQRLGYASENISIQHAQRNAPASSYQSGHDGRNIPAELQDMITNIQILDAVEVLSLPDTKKVCEYLHLSRNEIQDAELSVERGDISGQKRAILHAWRTQNGHGATKRKLLDALFESRNKVAYDTLKAKWNM